MPRYLVLALSFAGAIAACSDADRSPTAPPPSLVSTGGQGLGNDPDRIRVFDHRTDPFTAAAAGCISEPVVLTGTVHYLLHAQDNPGERVHFTLHTNLQGVSGVGQVTGTRYRLSQEHNVTYNYSFLETSQFETNQIFRYRLVGQGPDNNFWINISFHLTVTPDGRITSTSTRAEARCAQD